MGLHTQYGFEFDDLELRARYFAHTCLFCIKLGCQTYLHKDILMTPQQSDLFVLRRKAWVVNLSKPVTKLVSFYHRVTVDGVENLPRQGPALLLVKHRATRDSIFAERDSLSTHPSIR